MRVLQSEGSAESVSPEYSGLGPLLGRTVPDGGQARNFGHVFTDVPGGKSEPQHGGQGRVVENYPNLTGEGDTQIHTHDVSTGALELNVHSLHSDLFYVS